LKFDIFCNRQPPQSGGCAAQKNCPFLLKEKGRAQIKKCKGNFSARLRANARGGGGWRGRLGIPPQTPLPGVLAQKIKRSGRK
jgi:hypothetical protein